MDFYENIAKYCSPPCFWALAFTSKETMDILKTTAMAKCWFRINYPGQDLHTIWKTADTHLAALLILANNCVIPQKSSLLSSIRDVHCPVMVRMLIHFNADVNEVNGDNTTALHLACFQKNLDIITILLESNAPVNAMDCVCSTPLIEVCRSNDNSEYDLNIIDILLKYGAKINYRTRKGYHNPMNLSQMSALMWASYKGRAHIVNHLIANGADVNALNSNGNTAMDLLLL